MGILDGRAAIMIGASSGLGYGCALRFAQDGADVIAAARRTEKLDALVADARDRGFPGRIVPVKCDVAEEADIDAVIKACAAEFGKVEILACIAQGGLDTVSYLGETTVEQAIYRYQTGPVYTMLAMQKAFPYMQEQHWGRIITCASGSAVSATTGFTPYAMAKAAVMTLTRKASQEWGKYGIVTNCILPTTKNDHFGTTPQSAAALEKIAQMSPVGYLGDPYEDASPIVSFLASDGAHYLNGQMIGICGGLQLLA
jgi:NAD(P)-dependent dehydrogenase (short-subunit alcohol dehydrogenase family)